MAAITPPTLGALLDRPDLALRLVTPLADGGRPVRWVHSSDLEDPTPFLAEDVVLLTTGTQFRGEDAAQYGAYVERLARRGVTAVGFGTEVVRAGVPAGLIAACESAGLPLFEVPFRIPFIAIARANAEAIAAESYARRSWALAAQRAISLAALRPDALDAALAELARQLGSWAGLYDAAGTLLHARPARLPNEVGDALRAEAEALLAKGVRAADTARISGRTFALQTLGRGGELRGVLAVEAEGLDQDARGVVTSVVAMAGFALEQNQALIRARGALRAGVVRALLAGDAALAHDVAASSWGGLPDEPAVAAVTSAAPEQLAAFLELRAAQLRGRFFFGALPDGDGLLLLAARDADAPFAEAAARGGGAVGVSRPTTYARLAAAIEEAQVALARSAEGVTGIDDVPDALLSSLGEGARTAARALLAPLVRYDETHGTALLGSLRTWLEHDARFEDTARALGVHRHTVRSRIGLAEQLLGRDLSSFASRAEVWLALVSVS
ncbi:PucR family transcriptional regulator [Microbacterium sp. MEC084]|uniref:PucR family transcriptional regulator n=1 Tax=Microbacterium sp. MEC084 TaxID=1963027 RepID=UPI00106FE7CE|nr:PucR family transcriptional regulator [Microbacterium sp. MEC084]MCD1268412.1 PucR family transcriptional regulator [Microbacterium sp. MEC084]